MNILRNISSCLLALSLLLCLTRCAVIDDIPLPIVSGTITAFEVEGQCDATGSGYAAATIDNETRTIHLYVSDTVDLASLTITRLELSTGAQLVSDSLPTLFPDSFPVDGFAETPEGNITKVDFSKGPVVFTVRTFQNYNWTVTIEQVINREVNMSGQVGPAVIDAINQNVVVYVSTRQNLNDIKVSKFTLGGEHGTVSPDPSQEESYNFETARSFSVRYGWSDNVDTWNVFVYQTDAVIATTASAFPRTVSATISGEMANEASPVVEYRVSGEDEWTALPTSEVIVMTARYTADIVGLKPATTYEYRVTAGASATTVQTFTTTPALQLENASFDDWNIVGTGNQALYQPWKEGTSCYWDTGNRGATTVGASNSTFMTEGNRTFANLQSKYIVIKFAAGNIFTGTYLKTDGTNGILAFGRPFEAFPTKLKFDYRYHSSTINRGGGKWDSNYGRYISRETYDNLKGQPDSCQIYVALIGDKDEEAFDGTTYPFIIRTRPAELHLFNPHSDNVIAYAQLTQGNTIEQWQTATIPLDYHHVDRTPKYIIVVASSSKYGDYFVGGDESLLQLDNLELLYE